MEISNKLKERFCKDCNIPIPFVLRAARGESIQFLDNYFEYKGNVAMFSGSLGIKMPILVSVV